MVDIILGEQTKADSPVYASQQKDKKETLTWAHT